VRNAGSAKRMVASWIAEDPQRRAGRVVGLRLLTASGGNPAALLATMSRPAPLPAPLAAKASGPAWLWMRLFAPLRAAVLAIEASLALADLDGALAGLTRLDALHGSLATGAYAFHILYGSLFRHGGPLILTGNPSGNGAEIEVRLPLR